MYYLADAAIILCIAFALVLASWWSAHPNRSLLENTVIGCGVLLGAAASLFALRGHTLGLTFGLWPLLFFLLLPLDIPLSQKWRNFRANIQRALRGVLLLRGVELVCAIYLIFLCALTLLLSLAPPNGVDYDSLVYHLAAPQRYLLEGRIIELPYDHHSYFPFLTEMLFALGLHWKGAVLAKLFHWLMLPLCCLVLLAISCRHFSRRSGFLAACLFASLPVVVSEASTSYIDLALTLWVLLAFLCFSNWLKEDNTLARKGLWLLWSGVFCGFAISTKYLGVLFFGWLLLWALGVLVFQRTASPSDRLSFRPIIGFALIAIVLGGGWYVRNFWWTGNPVYPFAYEIFGGKNWTLTMAQAYTQSQMEYGYGRSLLDFIMLPWRLAMAPFNARNGFWPFSSQGMVAGVPGTSGLFEVNVLDMVVSSFAGPMLLALGAPLLLMRRKPPVIGLVIWSALFFGVFWAATGQYLRYLLPTFGLLCIACGWGAAEYFKRSTLLKLTAGLCLASWCLLTPVLLVSNARVTWAVILGVEEPEAYLARTFSAYPMCQWISQNTPVEAVLAVYGEPRGYYLHRRYFFADAMHSTLVGEDQLKNADEWISSLHSLGAGYLLWNSTPERNGGVGGPPRFIDAAIRGEKLQLLYEDRGYRVYKIAPGQKAMQ